jgi:hypothetical protein
MGAGRRKKEDDFLSFQEDRKLRNSSSLLGGWVGKFYY